jgi:hypothetical protein
VDKGQSYKCASAAADVLVAYTSVQGAGLEDTFAIVCSSEYANAPKVSVLLDIEDCQRLRDQLTDHIEAALLNKP